MYELNIKQYKPYGVKLVKIAKKEEKQEIVKKTKDRAKSTNVEKKETKTYVVKRGDCLWNISKAASGSGSNWRELYNLNKSVIGNNPNLIYPGQIIKI